MKTQKYKLSDFLTIGNGKDHKDLNEGKYPVYGSGGFMRNADSYLYDGESVLLPRKGTLSNIQYVSGKFWTVDTCYYTKINTAVVKPYYLFRLLRSFDLSGLDSGASIPSMTAKTYYGIKVELPCIAVQNEISTFLQKYDILIETNNKRIKVLEKMAEELYKEWFVRFRFPGHETAEFENGIPKGWEIVRMNDFCYVTDGTHDTPAPKIDGVPLVTGKSLKEGFVDFSETYNISIKDHEQIKKRSGLKDGDILFSNIGTVGSTCIVDYDREFSVKNVIIFKMNSIVKTVYLYLWLNSKPMQDIFSMQTNGSSQQFVGLTFMRKYKVLVPPQKVLESFFSLINPLFEERKILHKENENLIKQRDLLLPRLMSGKLEV